MRTREKAPCQAVQFRAPSAGRISQNADRFFSRAPQNSQRRVSTRARVQDERLEQEEEEERRRKRPRYVDDEAEESDGSE